MAAFLFFAILGIPIEPGRLRLQNRYGDQFSTKGHVTIGAMDPKLPFVDKHYRGESPGFKKSGIVPIQEASK